MHDLVCGLSGCALPVSRLAGLTCFHPAVQQLHLPTPAATTPATTTPAANTPRTQTGYLALNVIVFPIETF